MQNPKKISIFGSSYSSRVLAWMIGVSTLILFVCSSLRHALFQSGAYDLGIFDQAVYLISQSKAPISSFLGFHILGDHAALIFYPLALLYKIYPDVHWLLAVQAVALGLGGWLTWSLGDRAGLKQSQALAIAGVYLLYPLVFNVNLFDFHPEVLAIPALLGAILAARIGKIGWFCLAIITVLACKAVLALTVAAMGVWLLIYEKKRLYGAIALFNGIAWFIIATGQIIPFFGGEAASVARHLHRYDYLGNSVSEIVQNLLFKPGLLLKQVFSLDTLEYLILLLSPVIWGLSARHLTPMLGAIPTLALNILSNSPAQKNLVHHYSLPILPFLLVAVISSLAADRGWLRSGRLITLWSLVAFLALAKYGYFGSIYLNSLDTLQATQQAIAQVQTKGGVLTTAEIAPHLTHRQLIKLTDTNSPPANLTQFDYVLLNVRHPGWLSNSEFAGSLVNQLKNSSEFQLSYQRDDVYLFTQEKS
ncbi:MAG: DUF2079 domain-containing protein [Gloeocapsa sp. UFS-A4-WI-NPMV-4B04]|jgi:uncharacterized membrane protein|nr:DUF2079 domain-containing protein [Gloeocapsa sp. UFS-A4-WI-NPMV-4B04]